MFPHGLSNCSEDADMKEYASQLDDGYILHIQNLQKQDTNATLARHYSIAQNFFFSHMFYLEHFRMLSI